MSYAGGIWLGSEDSLMRVVQAESYRLQHPERASAATQFFLDEDSQIEPGFDSYLIQVEGEVGILNLAGPMVNSDSWINRLFGLISYPEISRAMQELVASDDIKSILLNIDSGGGSASGLEAVSETITWARKAKPVYAHTSSNMLSAAYWAAAAAKDISATKMASVGSIGAVITHRSFSEMLKKAGIDMTVIRAGKYKALGHPAETLSKEAQAHLQKEVDTLYGFFLEHVAGHRSKLDLAQQRTWAEGQQFFGQEAQEIGLVDKVMSLSARVEKLDSGSRQSGTPHNDGSYSEEVSDMGKKHVVLRSDKDKAALQSGAQIEGTEEVDEDTAAAAVAADSSRDTQGSDAQGAESQGGGEGASPADEGQEGEPNAAAAQGADAGVVAFLREQNAELSGRVTDLTVQLNTAQARASEAENNISGLQEIAAQAITNMQIALGQSPADLSGLPPSNIVRQHAETRKTFEERFKVGQQTRPMAGREDDQPADARRFGIVPKK